VTNRRVGLAALGAFAFGLLLPWLLGTMLQPSPGRGLSAAAVASSFLLNLLALSAAWMLLPFGPAPRMERKGAGTTTAQALPAAKEERPEWSFLCAGLRSALLAFAAFAGLWLSGAGLGLTGALTLAALTSSQALALTGVWGALYHLGGRLRPALRLALLAVCSLLTAMLLWTQPFLISLYKRHPRAAERTTEALVALCPVTAVAGELARQEGGFDLFRSLLTYRQWMGSYQLVAYPRLWPGREGGPTAGAGGEAGPWRAGLILKLLLWGAGLTLLSDYLNWLKAVREARKPAEG
jgi:hypothetical protein